MITVRHAESTDRDFWFRLDRHLPEKEFDRKVRDRMAFLLLEDGRPAGILRYNLFWDAIPFCTMLYVEEASRRRGCGRKIMEHWEQEMKALGHGMTMTSTQSDEQAQHFYRKLGYRDAGCLRMDIPGYEQPVELLFTKAL